MATQSVTINVASSNANNFMRVGGSLQDGFAGVSAPVYTVPSNKRLVLKGFNQISQGVTPGQLQFIPSVGSSVMTYVFGAGQSLQFNRSGGGTNDIMLFGFLEDDV